MIYIAKITFTGETARRKRPRPEPMLVVVKATGFNAACKKVANFSKIRWPYYRFVISPADYSRVVL